MSHDMHTYTEFGLVRSTGTSELGERICMIFETPGYDLKCEHLLRVMVPFSVSWTSGI